MSCFDATKIVYMSVFTFHECEFCCLLVQGEPPAGRTCFHELCVFVKINERRARNLDIPAATVRGVCRNLPFVFPVQVLCVSNVVFF